MSQQNGTALVKAIVVGALVGVFGRVLEQRVLYLHDSVWVTAGHFAIMAAVVAWVFLRSRKPVKRKKPLA